jgi:hypothetical protein
VLVRCETNKEADAVDSSLAHMEEVHDGVEKILKRVESDEQREDVEMYGHEMRVFTHDGKLNSEMIKHAAAQVEDWGAQAFDDAEKYIDEVNEGAALKRDAGAEGKRQMRIKEILRKLNNGVITKASADKQLRDVGHPGVDLTEEEE